MKTLFDTFGGPLRTSLRDKIPSHIWRGGQLVQLDAVLGLGIRDEGHQGHVPRLDA